jgi:hypothetical protein
VVVGVLLSPWLAGVTPVSEPITYERTPMVSSGRNKEENDSLCGLKGGLIPLDSHGKRTVDSTLYRGVLLFCNVVEVDFGENAEGSVEASPSKHRCTLWWVQFNQEPWQGRGNLIFPPIPALFSVLPITTCSGGSTHRSVSQHQLFRAEN